MDSGEWLWMYQSWLQDQEDQQELLDNQSIFIGSFSNPEAARKIIKSKNPDYETDEEDLDKLSEQIVKRNKEELRLVEQKNRRRRKRVIPQG